VNVGQQFGQVCALAAVLLAPLTQAADLRQEFLKPPDDCRIMMRWWWFGPAVTHQELARELRVMKEAGIGGVEIQPVYPLELDDPKTGFHNQPYLSPEFLEAVHFASESAHSLGMRVDITLGSGWPYGGPEIAVTQAAGRLRIEHSDVTPAMENGEKLIAAFPEKKLYFIASRTGQQVKRPSISAEGFVLNHFDRGAIEHHLHTVGDKLMEAFGTHPPYSVFSDSLEVYGTDWTDDFPAEFEKRRGYDLKPLLPELEESAAIRHDWALTLAELAEANYLTPIREWAHAHHTLFRSQSYGEPVVRLSSGAEADLAEGEAGPRWRVFNTARWAASTNHLYGRNVTSTETWTWLHAPSFRATPLDMKAEADLHFIEGINQLIGHGWPYSPPSAGEPGWRFYASAAFNDHNPWFQVMPDIARYLQRVSFLMRQGQPVYDVAVYLPTDDALAASTLGHVSVDSGMETRLGTILIPQILDAGYNFDYLDDVAMAKVALPYRVIILPGVERISLATLKRLQNFMDKGGKAIATRRLPTLAPGYLERNESAQVAALAKSMKMAFVEDESRLGSELRNEVPADLESASSAIGFAHRRTADRDIYFVVNTSNSQVKSAAKFRATGSPEEWDLFTGAVSGFDATELELAPYESKLVVFGGTALKVPAAVPAKVVADLSGDWKIGFEGATPQEMPVLKSWTDDVETKYFSGKATYSKTFNLDSVAGRLWLDFGQGEKVDPSPSPNGMQALLESSIRECALVYVNGSLAGPVWHPPYDVEISKLVRAGGNELKVVVANLAINEMAGKPLPTYRLLNLKYGERFVPQGFEGFHELPAGMLGPVKLIRK
jgi:hypothetical protein